MRNLILHLVSDSSGETVNSVAEACIVQFDDIQTEKITYPLVRTKEEMEEVIEKIEKNPGPVMYTIVNNELRELIALYCLKAKLPCIPVLSRAIADLSTYLNQKAINEPGRKHGMDDSYFSRVEAVNYAISHDDGQSPWDLEDADIILVGVSRTSKSPTCVYLGYRGYRTANIPFVSIEALPEKLFSLTKPLIIGLTISPERLIQVRKNRLISMNDKTSTNYVDTDLVRDELLAAKKLFNQQNWPVIDVTRRSVEETAAKIIQYYYDRHKHYII